MLEILLLDETHDRAGFECGEPALDRYLAETASRHARCDLARTFVLIDQDSPRVVLGYATLTLCTVAASDLPADLARRLPRSLPGVKLGRLAVDRRAQGKGRGVRLLMRALEETIAIADRAGGHALFVDATHAGVVPFYQRLGFTPLPSQPLVLFVTTASIRKLVATGRRSV